MGRMQITTLLTAFAAALVAVGLTASAWFLLTATPIWLMVTGLLLVVNVAFLAFVIFTQLLYEQLARRPRS